MVRGKDRQGEVWIWWYEISEAWKEVLCTTFRKRVRVWLEGVVSLRFDCEPFVDGDAEASPWPSLFLQFVGLALVTVACFILSHEPPTQSTSKTKH